MNTNTGTIRDMADLTEQERKSGEWVPVSDELAAAAKELDLARHTAKHRRDLAAAERQRAGLAKKGRR